MGCGRRSIYVGDYATNNEAEYQGLLLGLRLAQDLGVRRLEVRGDSALVAKQLNGEYAVRAPGLIPLFNEALRLLRSFDSYSITNVPREQNNVADALANEAMDRRY